MQDTYLYWGFVAYWSIGLLFSMGAAYKLLDEFKTHRNKFFDKPDMGLDNESKEIIESAKVNNPYSLVFSFLMISICYPFAIYFGYKKRKQA